MAISSEMTFQPHSDGGYNIHEASAQKSASLLGSLKGLLLHVHEGQLPVILMGFLPS